MFRRNGRARPAVFISVRHRSFFLLLLSLTMTVSACGSNSPERIGDKDVVLYTALGASDAFGIGAQPISKGYVYRIRDTLDRQIGRVNLINLGIPGAEIDSIADAARVFLQTGAKPDIVTLWTGANDVIAGRLVGDFEPELANLLGRLRSETRAFVVIANIPDLTKLPRFMARPEPEVSAERVRAFNDAIARQAARYNVPLVDLFSQPIERDLVSDVDGFHPSNEGHARIAQMFLDVILPAIGLKRDRVAAASGE